mmetsp:Transcript_24687/g.58635  ORF Transcript_24687/g.58635 Transcript_24687/m.58635 type:complete len:436 (-) Transcript_24687:669-1976(-)
MDLVAEALDIENYWLLLALDVASYVEVEGPLLQGLEVHGEGHGRVRPNHAAHRRDGKSLQLSFFLEACRIQRETEWDVLLVDQLDGLAGHALQEPFAKVDARLVHADARLLDNACHQEVLFDFWPQQDKRPERLLCPAALRGELEAHFKLLVWKDRSALRQALEALVIAGVGSVGCKGRRLLLPNELQRLGSGVHHIEALCVLHVRPQAHDLQDVVLRIQRSICLTSAAVVRAGDFQMAPRPLGDSGERQADHWLAPVDHGAGSQQRTVKVLHLHGIEGDFDLLLAMGRKDAHRRLHRVSGCLLPLDLPLEGHAEQRRVLEHKAVDLRAEHGGRQEVDILDVGLDRGFVSKDRNLKRHLVAGARNLFVLWLGWRLLFASTFHFRREGHVHDLARDCLLVRRELFVSLEGQGDRFLALRRHEATGWRNLQVAQGCG